MRLSSGRRDSVCRPRLPECAFPSGRLVHAVLPLQPETAAVGHSADGHAERGREGRIHGKTRPVGGMSGRPFGLPRLHPMLCDAVLLAERLADVRHLRAQSAYHRGVQGEASGRERMANCADLGELPGLRGKGVSILSAPHRLQTHFDGSLETMH